jgi:aspartate/tyrosine/aromatic aminotransferase
MELEIIKNSIHEIRGKKVMLDMDLAKLYEVETRVLKQAVRRNRERFPEDFMFELTKDEWNIIRSQLVMFKNGQGKFPKYLPFVFTEQGVAMLSAVLNSEYAVRISVEIMRAFVALRQWALNHQEISERLNTMEKQFGQKFTDIDQVLNYLIKKEEQQTQQTTRKQVGYKK